MRATRRDFMPRFVHAPPAGGVSAKFAGCQKLVKARRCSTLLHAAPRCRSASRRIRIVLGWRPLLPENPLMPQASDYGQKIDALRDTCPVKAAIDVIRGRWKPSILWELYQGTKRFCDLQAALAGISPQVLTVQLRQLEADGVLVRTVYAEVPTRVEYTLSDEGRSLSAVMDELDTW